MDEEFPKYERCNGCRGYNGYDIKFSSKEIFTFKNYFDIILTQTKGGFENARICKYRNNIFITRAKC